MDFQEKISGHIRNSGDKKDNYVPCILYSKQVKESIPFFLDTITIKKMYNFMTKNRLLNYVFNIDVNNVNYKVIVRDMQKDYVRNEITHMDFLHLHKDSKTNLKIEVIFLNKGSSAIEKGHKMYFMNSPKLLPIRCIGEQTLSNIEIDLNKINSNTVLYSDQLNWPSNVTCGLKRIVLKAIPKKVVEKAETDKKAKKKK